MGNAGSASGAGFCSFMCLSIILLLPQIFWLHCFPEIQLSQNRVSASVKIAQLKSHCLDCMDVTFE